MMPLPYVGSKMFTAFQGRVPIKLNNLTDKKPIQTNDQNYGSSLYDMNAK